MPSKCLCLMLFLQYIYNWIQWCKLRIIHHYLQYFDHHKLQSLLLIHLLNAFLKQFSLYFDKDLQYKKFKYLWLLLFHQIIHNLFRSHKPNFIHHCLMYFDHLIPLYLHSYFLILKDIHFKYFYLFFTFCLNIALNFITNNWVDNDIFYL